jgi:hypothetical protein
MLLALLGGCLDNEQAPSDVFIALQSDFADFESWDATPVSSTDTGHAEGARTVYLNRTPESGADQFAVGTMIVKRIETDAGEDLHAMAKRGGGFNPDGAVGWEWFELVEIDATPVIKWRGINAPEGEAYGQLPGSEGDTADSVTGDCNVCHSSASSNDFVHTIPL